MTSSATLLFALLAASAAVSPSCALTEDQISRFMTGTMIETNTGRMGAVSVATADGVHTITSNGVPDHQTPEYPNRANPNDITTQTHVWQVPVDPTVAASPTALPLGPVGVAINGIPFFNPYTKEGEDAVLTETFDSCDGHPTERGIYHYHRQPSHCVFAIVPGQPSPFIGVALDGFPIYGPIDENGTTLTSANLDACHGRFVDGEYRYHTTADFPYILGCFKGEYTGSRQPPPPGGPGPMPSNGQGRLKTANVSVALGFIAAIILQNWM